MRLPPRQEATKPRGTLARAVERPNPCPTHGTRVRSPTKPGPVGAVRPARGRHTCHLCQTRYEWLEVGLYGSVLPLIQVEGRRDGCLEKRRKKPERRSCLIHELEHEHAKVASGDHRHLSLDLRETNTSRREQDPWKVEHRYADPITTLHPHPAMRGSGRLVDLNRPQ